MKKYFNLLTLLLAILPTNINSQSGWEQQFSGTTSNLNDVWFTDSTSGIIIGEEGTLLTTSNGGEEWIKKELPTQSNLFGISFIDDQYGAVYGENKAFFKTTDAGQTWTDLSDSLEETLDGFDFWNKEIAYAVSGINRDRTVYKTTDGGMTWSVVSQPSQFYMIGIISVNCLSKKVITIVYGSVGGAKVIKSIDGGYSWTDTWYSPHSSSTSSGFDDAIFIDSSIGFLACHSYQMSTQHGFLFRTTDGGDTWNEQLGSIPRLRNIHFADSSIGSAVGYTAVSHGTREALFLTENGGKNWTKIELGMGQLNGVFFKDSINGTVVGNNGLIFTTNSGGAILPSENWYSVYTETDSYYKDGIFRSIHFFDDTTGIVANGGPALKTTNGGMSWFTEPNLYGSRDLDFYDYYNGVSVSFGATGKASVQKTNNAGKDWQTINFTDPELEWTKFLAAAHLAIDHFVIAGIDGKIATSTDQGASWTKIYTPRYADLWDMFFIDENIGYVVGSHGDILKSTDGGFNWIQLTSNTETNLRGVFFTDMNNGFVVGKLGSLLRTTNAGEDWFKQDLGTFNDLNKITFDDTLNGIIVGSLGTILRTSDGGESWYQEISGTNQQLYNAVVIDSVSLVIGSKRTILRSGPTTAIDSTNGDTTDVELPSEFSFSQNYPNPFNPSTTIEYSVPQKSKVTIKIFDVLGRKVITLVDEEKTAGNYKAVFNASNLSSGIYFYRIEAADFVESKKMILMK